MELPSDLLEERWGFLVPWCAALRGRAEYRKSTIDFWRREQKILVSLPAFSDGLPQVCEALALLGAVEYVDHGAWKYLLTKYVKGDDSFMDEIVDNVSHHSLQLTWRTSYDGNFFVDNLVYMCGAAQNEDPTAEYLDALKKIASLNNNPSTPGVEIEIPVQVRFNVNTICRIRQDDAPRLRELLDAERSHAIVRETWKQREPIQDDAPPPGSLKCTFRLDPMIASLDAFRINSKLAEVFVRMSADNVWFSEINSLSLHVDPEVDGPSTSKKHFSQIVSRIFRPPPGSRPLSIHLSCPESMQLWEVETMCSAMINQTVRTLKLRSGATWAHRTTSRKWWMWLAYSLFSKRARACSSLESLVLKQFGSLSADDMDGFMAVLESDHPEELLCNCTHGQVDERDGTLNAGASIRWNFDDQYQNVVDSEYLTLCAPMPDVRTFSDDGKSMWMNAIVPGYGQCQVRRQDLVFHAIDFDTEKQQKLQSLQIVFTQTVQPNLNGLPQFLAAISVSLKFLTLAGRNSILDMNMITARCPNLRELTLSGETVDILADFGACQERNEQLPTLNCNLGSIQELAMELSDNIGSLAKCTRRLTFYHDIEEGLEDANGLYVDFPVKMLGMKQMLEVNQELEYVKIIEVQWSSSLGYHEALKVHNHEVIGRVHPLTRKRKLAFLSILFPQRPYAEPSAKHPHCRAPESLRVVNELDQIVLSKIFAFASSPILRRVCIEEYDEEYGSDEEDW